MNPPNQLIVPPLFQHSLKTFFNYTESIDQILFSYLTLADFISVKYTCEQRDRW